MKGRSQAILVMAALTILSWMLSLASLLAAAAVALPTLRRGGREGLWLIAGALPVVALAGQMIMGSAVQAGGFALAMWLPLLVIAMILRETASLSMAVMATVGLGILVVLGCYAVIGDPAAYWGETLGQAVRPMLEQRGAGGNEAALLQSMAVFARFATGAIAAGSVLTVLLSLFIARWWQASLYNPGGFRAEFLGLRMPKSLAGAFLLMLAVAATGGGAGEIAANLSVPMFMAFLLTGFSVVHALCAGSPSGRFWLIGLYIGMMFMAPLLLLVALAGLTDAWLDWRRRLSARRG